MTKKTKKGPEGEKPPSEAKRPQEENESSTFHVEDRRFWVKKDWDPREKTESRLPSVLERLEHEVKDRDKKMHEVRQAAVAVRQESEAFRERLERDVSRKVDGAKAHLMVDLLELADNLERSIQAFKSAFASDKVLQDDNELRGRLEALVQGLDMIGALFQDKLSRHGVRKLDVLNKPYNPETAEALDTEKTSNEKLNDIVVKVFQDGYSLDGRTIRAARVVVAKYDGKPTPRDESAALDTEEESYQ